MGSKILRKYLRWAESVVAFHSFEGAWRAVQLEVFLRLLADKTVCLRKHSFPEEFSFLPVNQNVRKLDNCTYMMSCLV